MISFRFHLVSIVAVFLALALGILLGTTVVKQGVIDDLNRRTTAAVNRSQQLRQQVGNLESSLRSWDTFGKTVEPFLLSDQLTGRPVVIVTVEGVDLGEVDGVRQALQDSGATLQSVLFVTPRMALPDQGSQTQLATILSDGTQPDPAKLASEAAGRLADRLRVGAPSGDTSGSSSDFIQQLVSESFLVIRGGTASVQEIGGGDLGVVILAGGSQNPPVAPDSFLQPLATSLVDSFQPVVVGETLDTVYPFVPLLRGDGSVKGRLVTVDDADTMPGRIAVVLGLRDLIGSPGHGGDYGVKSGATSLIPKP